MKIKRFLVEEKEYVMGEIERFLCIHGISYVTVENEIHCPNVIFRFFDFHEIEQILPYLFALDQEKRINDSLLVIEEGFPLQLDYLERASLLKSFRKVERNFLLPPQKPLPKGYPGKKENKKKQLRLENQKYRIKP